VFFPSPLDKNNLNRRSLGRPTETRMLPANGLLRLKAFIRSGQDAEGGFDSPVQSLEGFGLRPFRRQKNERGFEGGNKIHEIRRFAAKEFGHRGPGGRPLCGRLFSIGRAIFSDGPITMAFEGPFDGHPAKRKRADFSGNMRPAGPESQGTFDPLKDDGERYPGGFP